LTSKLPFRGWETIFQDVMKTEAAIDNLVHHGGFVEVNIPSYQAEQANKAKRGLPATTVEEGER
jgi:DNA replication protein DnaC